MDAMPVVKVTRSGVCECVHRGSIAVIQNNKLVYAIGNPYIQIPLRSTAKPLIAKSFINSGATDKFNIDACEIAIMASSHNGEDKHRKTVSSILSKIGASEGDLKCGIHDPYFPWIVSSRSELTQLHHNCSGKHAGTIMLCKMLNVSTDNYWEFSHPVQQLIYKDLCTTLTSSPARIKIGVDGCGVPTYIIPLIKLAEAYHTIFKDDVLKIVASSMLLHPFMVAGTDRLDSKIISICGYIAKSGSEGIFCLSIPKENMSIAIKIESGSDEAAESVAVEILDKLGLITHDQLMQLEKYRCPAIVTSTGVIVGHLTPIF